MTHEVATNEVILVPGIRQQELSSVRNRTACEHIGVSFDLELCCFLGRIAIVHAGDTQMLYCPSCVIYIDQGRVQDYIDQRVVPDCVSIIKSPGGKVR